MARNPLPLLVPCHRVVAAGGRPGGFSAPGGLTIKARLLELEGGTLTRPRRRRGRLPFDPEEAVAALVKADSRLARLIRTVGPLGLEVEPRRTPFESLTRSIAYQQLTGKAAAKILARVRALYPPPFPTPEAILATSEADLRAAGLSWSKVAALRDLAAKTLDGTVPSKTHIRRLSDEEILTRLVKVRGIGPWSVEMFLLFGLGRTDVFPVTDYGVRKGFAATFALQELPDAATMIRRGERWRPWRSVASWYLWRAAELG
jgi:3-methyladenine DNA glycosylase/8-oxoguanine DNA glycosylase